MYTIEDLPEEILEMILLYVSPYEDLKSCFMVCSHWHYCCRRVVRRRKKNFLSAILNGPLSWNCSKPLDEPASSSFNVTRFSHSACIVGTNMFVFGGCTFSHTTFNDLWKIDLKTKKKERILTKGNYPSPKSHSSMIVWRNSLVLYGGWTSPSVYPLHQQGILFDELHICDLASNTWKQHYLAVDLPAIAGHSATLHGDCVVYFGGLQRRSDTSCSINDILCLDLVNMSWFVPAVSELRPSARYGHSQTKIDETHVLIMAGCGGYNNLHNDVWLLTIPENIFMDQLWTWKLISVEGIDHMPRELWCNPCCKVEDHIVVLARKNDQKEGVIRTAPFLFRSGRINSNEFPVEAMNKNTGERHLQNQAPLENPSQPEKVDVAPSTIQQYENSPEDDHLKPSIRPNASNNRERRLSMLSKYEKRLSAISKKQVIPPSDILNKVVNVELQKPGCTQVVYLLDLRSLLSSWVVRWQPGPAWVGVVAPHPRLLCTLLLGRGELIVCGGKKSGECMCVAAENQPTMMYITAPSAGHS